MDKIIESLEKLIAIPSVKAEKIGDMPFGKDVAEALSFALDLCSELGFRTKNCNNYCGYAEAGTGEEMLGILAHLDVVPAGDGWDNHPFQLTLRNGNLYGRGILDDKGAAVICIYAIKELLDEGFDFKKKVRIIFGTDEESDWEDMEYYTKNEEVPDFGFTPDADFPLIYAEKGILSFDLCLDVTGSADEEIIGGEAVNMVPDKCEATVLLNFGEIKSFVTQGKSAHASTPENGENAISEMMKKLYQMKENGEISIDSRLNYVIDFYDRIIGYGYDGADREYGLKDDESGSLTMNVGKIHMEEKKCVISIDVRYPLSFDKNHVLELFKKTMSNEPVDITNINYLPPVHVDKDSKLVSTLLDIYRNETGDMTEPLIIGGGTYSRAMDNIIAFGPLFPWAEDTAHQKNEHISIEDFKKMKIIYKKAIKALCSEERH